MSLTNIIHYTTSSNFTFDGNLIAFNGTNAQLKNIRPISSTFYAGYFTSVDGDYGNGVLTGTPHGAPSAANNLLTLSGGLNYVDYSAVLNADSAQQGTVRFDYIPTYNGTPSTYQVPLVITQVTGSSNNIIELVHFQPDGTFRVLCNDQSGASISNMNFGLFNPIAGTSYEIEFDYDFTGGNNRLFINGMQFGPTIVATGTRNSATIGLLRVGSDWSLSYTANFNVANVIIFNTVQHTANFPGEIPRPPETLYSIQNPPIIVNAAITASELITFSENATKPANTAIQYYLIINGSPKYWNGSAWTTSNMSYAQTNTAAVINTNAAALNIIGGVNIQVAALLDASFGNATPILTSIVEVYNFGEPSPIQPPDCDVYVFLQDIMGSTIVSNAFLNVELPRSIVISGYVVAAFKTSVAFSDAGFASLPLVQTIGTGFKYNFSITYTDSSNTQRFINFVAVEVPASVSVGLDDITTIENT